jgi:hypothetical protein
MPRYTATIEFDSVAPNTNDVKYHLEQYLSQYKNLNIKSVTQISISPEQALKEIGELIYGSRAVSISIDAIRSILNKVA